MTSDYKRPSQIVTDEEIARLLQEEELRETEHRYYPSMNYHNRLRLRHNEHNNNTSNNNNFTLSSFRLPTLSTVC